jgi:hypothetical protein
MFIILQNPIQGLIKEFKEFSLFFTRNVCTTGHGMATTTSPYLGCHFVYNMAKMDTVEG